MGLLPLALLVDRGCSWLRSYFFVYRSPRPRLFVEIQKGQVTSCLHGQQRKQLCSEIINRPRTHTPNRGKKARIFKGLIIIILGQKQQC